jgi:hypothetical protein
LRSLSGVPGYAWHLVQRGRALGSNVHLHFAAQGPAFDALFQPHAVSGAMLAGE